MSDFKENPIPSATYTSVLMNCYNAVITNLNLRRYCEAMDCMETFICALKPNVREEIKKTLEDYAKQLDRINKIVGIDAIDTMTIQRREAKRLMQAKGYPLLTSITDALAKHGWLNKESSHPIGRESFEEIEENADIEEL